MGRGGVRVWVGIEEGSRDRREDAEDGDAGHAEDRELTEGVQGSQLDEDDVDDVVAAGDLRGLAEVPLRDLGAFPATDDGPRGERTRQPGADRDHCVAQLLGTLLDGELLRQLAKHQHDDQHRQDLDEQLGEADIGRTEEEDLHGHCHADATEQHGRADP